MEKKIHFSELIYASCQKSLVTGSAGFQVRTHTDGLDRDIIEAVGRSNLYGYSLPDEKRVSVSQLKENPKIVCQYPRTFVYKKIKIDNGEQKYVFSRTAYIGIDYGYFCGGSATRDGANYITHVLIFDNEPSKDIFNVLLQNNYFGNSVFLPLDNTCSPDNKELTFLLTGEPQPMPTNSLENREPQPFNQLPDYMSDVIAGVLQLYISRKYRQDENKCLIVKAPHNIADSIAANLKLFMPDEFVKDLTFTTNYFRNGLPNDIDVVFVNEFYDGNLYEDEHICVDLFLNKHIGIDNNVIFDKVIDYVSNDIPALCHLLDYLLTVDLSDLSKYRFLLDVFLFVKLGKDMPVTEITTEFVDKLTSVGLSETELKSFWEKINTAVADGLQSGCIEQTAETIAALQRLGKKNINIPDAAREQFTQLVFDAGIFSKIVNKQTIHQIAGLVIPPRDHAELLFDYVVAHPDSEKQFNDILEEIFLESRNERFSELLPKVGNDVSLVENISPIVEKYFCRNANIEEFISMLDKMPREIHSRLKIGVIPKTFIQNIYQKPDIKLKQAIEKFLNFDLKICEEEKKSFAAILAVMNDEKPEEVNKDEMLLTYKLGNMTLLKNVFNGWLKKGFTGNDLQSFLKQANHLEGCTPIIEHMAVSVWNAQNQVIKTTREDLIKIILDHAKWDKNSYRDFLKRKEHQDLAAFISKSSSVVSKLFNIFKK